MTKRMVKSQAEHGAALTLSGTAFRTALSRSTRRSVVGAQPSGSLAVPVHAVGRRAVHSAGIGQWRPISVGSACSALTQASRLSVIASFVAVKVTATYWSTPLSRISYTKQPPVFPHELFPHVLHSFDMITMLRCHSSALRTLS